MNNVEQILEFDKVKEIWAEYALTDTAKVEIRGTHPLLSARELLSKQRDTTESCEMIRKCGNPPLASLNGVSGLVGIAQRGECLTASQLIQIEQALSAVNRLKSYLCKGKIYEISLAFYEENIHPLELLRTAIYTQITGEAVSDNASKLLKDLRREIAVAEEKMREKADAVIRTNKECMSDSFSTFRNGHICIPVKKEYKFRISGSIIDKSSTGNTLFIEPTVSAKYYEELQNLRIDEENEVRRILYTLTGMVDDFAEELLENVRMMERLDFIFSKGKFSISYDGVVPKIVEERCIKLTDARHPLMNRTECVPLQFQIGNCVQGIVITGPNTGGKTVALKTVALNCMMAQCGLHVPCTEAIVCMNSNYLCDIGDGQNLSENLSTFSAHITNVLDILHVLNKESLVLMDELGSGTDPLEGMGIAVAILEELKKSGALFLVTTHYPEVKVYAEKTEGILNARMTFDKENLKPLYQMVIGEAGESCAFYIARRLGMSARMLEKASEAAYGRCMTEGVNEEKEPKRTGNSIVPRIIHENKQKKIRAAKYQLGDSVMIYPDKKIGIVCKPENEKGVLQVQLPDKKIWINHKRVKLHVSAQELYPENYDFSIIFESVENRKLRHQMERKYVEGQEIVLEE